MLYGVVFSGSSALSAAAAAGSQGQGSLRASLWGVIPPQTAQDLVDAWLMSLAPVLGCG
ncbi:hypothetical protein GCM10008949_51670 [Deinococcus humi]|nr:hypothetical protein GCM10008949_51670 [Deinococcus humi]